MARGCATRAQQIARPVRLIQQVSPPVQQIVVHSSDFCLIAAGSPSTCPSARGSRQITSRAATSNSTARRSSSTSWSVAWLAAPDAGVSHPAFVCLPVLRRGQARRDAASCEQGIHGARGRLALVCGEGPHSGRHPARAVCDRVPALLNVVRPLRRAAAALR